MANPRASADRVSYSHGSLKEWYANGPLGLEQGFVVSARPSAGSGPMTFSLALSGNLASRLQHGSLLLTGQGVALDYGGLLATDARGHVLHSWLQLIGGRLLIRVDDRGAVYPLRIDPLLQQAELTASSGASEDELGASVAVSGDTIVVGAPNFKVGEVHQGAAFVFVRPATGWATAHQNAELTSSNGEEGDEFGESVAISGNNVVVGAHFEKVGGHDGQGAAYVFVMPRTGWAGSLTQSAELVASDGAMLDHLGFSVAISGKTVLAGAPHRNGEQGAAYVFSEPSGGWGSKEAGETVTQAAELTASGGAANDELGLSVAVSGKTGVAGAPGHKVAESEKQGTVYAFSEPSGGWGSKEAGEVVNQAAELIASGGAAKDELGLSVAVSGGTVVTGAPGKGLAYVFSEPGGGWGSKKAGEVVNQAAQLTAPTPVLGESVVVSGTTAIAGAPSQNLGKGEIEFQGALYVFVMPAGGWKGSVSQTAELTGEKEQDFEFFGHSVAISGDTLLIGAPGLEVGEHKGQGAAYVYEEPPSVAISSPTNGATYTQGQLVKAEYSCATALGTSVTCTGPVANGAPIETSALGAHSLTVNAIDSDGLSASQSVSYNVVAAPVTQLLTPILSGLSETAKTWREGNLLARISITKSAKRKPPLGTTFSFSLNEAANVAFTFTEPASGRKVAKKCVAQTRANKNKHRCTHTVIAGTLTFSAHAGTNHLSFEGLISRHKKLKPGSYTLLVTATASGKRSTTRTLHFSIARG